MEETVGVYRNDPWINMEYPDRNEVDDDSRKTWMEISPYLITAEACYLGC